MALAQWRETDDRWRVTMHLDMEPRPAPMAGRPPSALPTRTEGAMRHISSAPSGMPWSWPWSGSRNRTSGTDRGPLRLTWPAGPETPSVAVKRLTGSLAGAGCGGLVELDMAAVSELPETHLALLLTVRTACAQRGATLRLVDCPPAVSARLLHCGLSSLFELTGARGACRENIRGDCMP